jgi:hypothetical protein
MVMYLLQISKMTESRNSAIRENLLGNGAQRGVQQTRRSQYLHFRTQLRNTTSMIANKLDFIFGTHPSERITNRFGWLENLLSDIRSLIDGGQG